MRDLLIAVLVLTGGLLSSVGWALEGKPKVVATFSILGDVVQNVGGDHIDLTILVGPDGDAHTFEPTPKDIIPISKADVIFENGLHFEHWLNDLYESSASKAKRVVVTEGIKPLTLIDLEQTGGRQQTDELDPHVWQDVHHVIEMVKQVQKGLIQADPVHQKVYEENAQRYIDQLTKLDQWIIKTAASIPPEKRKLITSHDALGYFAQRYGFQVIGTVIPSATTEAEDPSAAEMGKLISLIKSVGVKSLFSENIQNPKLIKALAKDTGAVLAPGLYTDALGAKGSEGETYIKMMVHNVKIFAEYLK